MTNKEQRHRARIDYLYKELKPLVDKTIAALPIDTDSFVFELGWGCLGVLTNVVRSKAEAQALLERFKEDYPDWDIKECFSWLPLFMFTYCRSLKFTSKD